MRALVVHIFALLLCSVLPAVLYLGYFLVWGLLESLNASLWHQFPEMFMLITFIAAVHSVALGLPIYFLVKSYSPFTYKVSMLCGFVVGSVPIAIFTWPLYYLGSKSSSSVNGVQIMIDGVPTMSGWLYYIEGVCLFGFLGSSGALMFKYVLQKCGRYECNNNLMKNS